LLEELKDGERGNRRFTWEDLADESVFTDNWQVTWELFRRFGVLPAAGDRHPRGVRYVVRPGRPGDAQPLGRQTHRRRLPGETLDAGRIRPDDGRRGLAGGRKEFELEPSGEEFLDILEGLTGDGPYVTNVNLPNTGQISDLEQGPVVETNAVVRAGQVKPVAAGGFPRPVRSMIQGHIDTIETVVEAARDGDVDRAFQGFSIDPQVQTLTPDESRTSSANSSPPRPTTWGTGTSRSRTCSPGPRRTPRPDSREVGLTRGEVGPDSGGCKPVPTFDGTGHVERR